MTKHVVLINFVFHQVWSRASYSREDTAGHQVLALLIQDHLQKVKPTLSQITCTLTKLNTLMPNLFQMEPLFLTDLPVHRNPRER